MILCHKRAAFFPKGRENSPAFKTSRFGLGRQFLNERYSTIILGMKLAAFFMLVGCLHAGAKGFSQTITLTGRNLPLRQVFDRIEDQTGFGILIDRQTLAASRPVTINVKDATIEQVMRTCLKDQPFPLTFTITGHTINVIKGGADDGHQPAAELFPAGAPPKIIAEFKGHVTNEAGEPLQGASVEVKSMKMGTFTDVHGTFILKNIPSNAILTISYTGYQRTEVKLTGSSSLSIILKIALNNLDQVQIIAYGSTTQRLNTGDVTTVNSKEIEEQPVENPMLALEGRVPGLFIQQSTGVPGSGLTIRLQGQNSLSGGNDPLYVIDGVPYPSQLLPNIGTSLGILGSNGNTNANAQSGGGNPQAFINPADIESISILKDADATAIYGSRAANGAVLITTKHGKPGKTKVELNCYDGWGHVDRMMPLLNTQQYLAMRHEALVNSGKTPGANDFDLNGLWDTTRYTNWEKSLIGGTAHYTDNQVTVSGGDANTTFLAGVGYHRQTTVFPGDMSDEKGNVHMNLTNISSNQRFRFQMTGTYLIDQNDLFSTDLTSTAIQLAPDAPALRNADGSLNWAPNAAGNSSWTNPLSYLLQAYHLKTTNLIGNLVTSYELLKGLDLKLNAGYNTLSTNDVQIDPLSSVPPEEVPYSSSASIFGNETISTWTVEPQLTYRATIKGGILDALVGGTALQTNGSMNQTYAYGFTSDQELYNMSAASNLSPNIPSIASVYKYSAGFARIGYRWQDKYLVDLTGRRDGSSRFGSSNEFHNFGSVAAGWIFSNESFLKSGIPALSFGKLRASYGTTGNDQIGDYQYLPLYSPISNNVQTPYQGTAGLASNGLSNPYLQWELTKKLQFGLNLGFWKDRVLFSGNYYLNRSSNELQKYALPQTTGNTAILSNFPALIQNNGWELTLNTANIKKGDFAWSTGLNLTIPRNKLVSYPDLATSTYANLYVVGQPVTIIKVYKYEGVNPTTGLYQFGSASGQATSSPNIATDATSWVNLAPKFFGGLDNTFRYKGLSLDILFQFVNQVGRNYIYGRFPGRFLSSNYGVIEANQPTWVLNHWQASGENGLVQRFASNYTSALSTAFNAATQSTLAYSDASFIRLKNLSLSWQLPGQWMRSCRLEGIRLYAQGQNLLTLTHFKGLDPENQSTTALPPLRVITMGADVNF